MEWPNHGNVPAQEFPSFLPIILPPHDFAITIRENQSGRPAKIAGAKIARLRNAI
jgi:hypothetical protein